MIRIIGVAILIQGAVGSLACVRAAEALAPPFGLKWGDAPNSLVNWALKAKLDQTVKSPAEQPRLKILMISHATGSLPKHEATMLEARFMDGRLFEVALHYGYPGQSADFVRGKFNALKGILSRRHGVFRLSGNKREGPLDGIITRSSGYRIDPTSDEHLVLAFTEVVDARRGDAAARFSVMYHSAAVLAGNGERIVIRRDGVDLPEGQRKR